MAKSKKTVEPYKDVKELNWETESAERKAESGKDPGQETGPGFEERGSRGEDRDWEIGGPAADLRILERRIIDVLQYNLNRVDPEIAKDNPVWKWALCDDHCTFVFRDGRKAVINF